MNLQFLTDRVLLTSTKELAQEYRDVTTKLLHHLKEIESRKLYSELGYSSLFSYVVKELGFSEASAARRIKAAEMLKQIPTIEKKIESGELTLTNLAKASDSFRQNNITDPLLKISILEKLENTSTRACEKNLLELTGTEIPVPRREIRPIAKSLNLLTVTLNDLAVIKLEELKGMLAHRKLGQDKLFEVIFEAAIKRITAEKFKTESIKVSDSKNPRFISAHIKKAVYLRDKVCKKCGRKWALEYDHILPYSMGGKAELQNIRLLCKSCNQRHRKTQRL